MSNDQPPPGQPPEDDPFLKKPSEPQGPGQGRGQGQGPRQGQWQGQGQGQGPQDPQGPHEPPPPQGPPPPSGDSPHGSPYGAPYGGEHGPPKAPPYDPNAPGGSPYGGSPYGQDPYGGGGPHGGTDPLAGMPPLAPFATRLAARVIDALIIFIPLAIVSLLVGGWRHSSNTTGNWDEVTNQVNTGTQWVWSLISIIAYVGYDTLMTKKYGQTLGKRWLRLRVAMLNDGSVPEANSSLTRALVLWVPALLCCLFLWWFIIIVTILASRPYRQGLHDKAARTVVVTAPR
ncbi:RDD family protein [Streptomyces sp. NPDC096310]|uniref:RDD family protein n=1 Tax=Streptomyces sp. NPDC096310 TaxID=3366082 RepID=UPI003820A6B6